MLFVLSKLLIFFLRPFVWICILLILALFKKKYRRRLLGLSLLLLFFFSNSFIIGKVANWYEPAYPRNQVYDVGIVLGGYSSYNKYTNKIAFGSSSDRLFQAISLFKQHKIQRILLSSGNANLIDTVAKEADLTLHYLQEVGIPDSCIMIENQSRNTLENAKFSLSRIRKEIPNAKILVITSAWHIPRSKLIFSRFPQSGLNYYPTDFLGKASYDFSDFIIPDATALSNWDKIIKEWVGYLVDGFRK